MILNIKKSISWKKIFFITLDEERKIVRKEKLAFKNRRCEIELDLEKEKFIYFSNEKNKSQIVVLSTLLDEIELFFNHKTRQYTCYLSIKNHEDYGMIRTIKFEDRNNLSFRRNKSKIVNIYTPSSYDTNKEYGVIFIFDSQNIFDINKFGLYTKNADPYGGWQVEATIENVIKKYNDEYIVIGIDDSDQYRMAELMVHNDDLEFKKEFIDNYGITKKDYSRANLDKFGKFIVETVLTYIENNYKIKKYNIGICGSSAGGNASLYLGMKYPNIFRFIFTFTPAIGFYTDESLINFFKKGINQDKPQPEIYYFQGVNGDLEKLLTFLNSNLVTNLIKAGINKENIITYIEPTAEHNEDAWRYAFNYFMELHSKKSVDY